MEDRPLQLLFQLQKVDLRIHDQSFDFQIRQLAIVLKSTKKEFRGTTGWGKSHTNPEHSKQQQASELTSIMTMAKSRSLASRAPATSSCTVLFNSSVN